LPTLRPALALLLATGLATAATAAGPGGSERLDAALAQIAAESETRGAAAAFAAARARALRVVERDGRPLLPVIVEPRPGRRADSVGRARIEALGAEVDAASRSFLRVHAPPGALRALARGADVGLVRSPARPQAHALGLGANVSESVEATGAADLQDAGFTGAGVRVAIVDLGFVGLSQAIAQGELPAGTVVVDLPGSHDDDIETGTDHGVGVAEHVADMAPGAELHVLKVGDEVDLENAAAYLRDAGIHVANHSVGWVNASYYDDTGPINAVVNESRDVDGVLWTVSAGNAAERHWRGAWTDSDGDAFLEFVPGDEVMALTSASSSICVFLNWDDYPGSSVDLDLWVLNDDFTAVAVSDGPQSGTQAPSEAACLSYLAFEAPYHVVVEWWSGSDPPPPGLDVTLFSFDNDFQHPVAASSVMDPAGAHGAFAVAAVDQDDWDLADPPTQPYSSQGPTTDGRLKPELAAPDGTTSFTFGFEGSFGTSFSAPTTAGAAALLLEEDPARTADDVADRLLDLARDAGAGGPDPVYGAGLLHVQGFYACRDGLDNDGDGLVDFPDDPGCREATSQTESPECDDGLDNDGNGKIDFPDDPGCFAAYDANEQSGGSGSGGCGLGGELVLLLPPLLAWHRRLRVRG